MNPLSSAPFDNSDFTQFSPNLVAYATQLNSATTRKCALDISYKGNGALALSPSLLGQFAWPRGCSLISVHWLLTKT
jgi:hypothetical protein